jgi:hypothetical protein
MRLASSTIFTDEPSESQNTIALSSATGSPSKALRSLARFSASSQPGSAAELRGVTSTERGIPRTKCLLSDGARKGDGVGPVMDLKDSSSKLLVLTLNINSVVERTGLTVSVWGSPDQTEWGGKPLLTFRQRQYCGVYSVLLNLATYPDIRYLRVHWQMNRWGRTEHVPVFGFEVFLEESGARLSSAVLA